MSSEPGALSVLPSPTFRERGPSAFPALGPAQLQPLWARLQRLAPRWRSYGRWKVRLDPVYPMALAQLADAQNVLDLGAGIGLMAALLAERRPGLRMRAVEWDRRKASVARVLLEDLPGVGVEEADARTVALGSPDAILLLDVLHYSEPALQRQWLSRCAAALAPGGVLLIRELDSALSRLAERLDRWAVRWKLNRGAAVHAWPIVEMVAALRGLGFDVEATPAGRGIFRANAFVVARRSPSSGAV